MMIRVYLSILLLACTLSVYAQEAEAYIAVLGIAQDGGYPHMGCTKKCCNKAWAEPYTRRHVVCLALVDPATKKWWLFEATPDIKEQLHNFQLLTRGQYNYLPEGIFITHAHIGHYTGLMELGREVMNTRDMPVYVLPGMKKFLETNGPWSQLVSLHNISIRQLTDGVPVALPSGITVIAVGVPHRDEYSETAGFVIHTPVKKYLFIPDIDKWSRWNNKDIVAEVKQVDVALLDGTFYDGTELPGRNMSEVPHPFVIETIARFKDEDAPVKAKVHFIHFNHTNPVMWDTVRAEEVKKQGFSIAAEGEEL
jgi:pyrroloquinoline quinone biosynthesis protein B